MIMSKIDTINNKITETRDRLIRLKERYDKTAAELEMLYKKKEELELEELLEAIKESDKTRAEVLAFLESK